MNTNCSTISKDFNGGAMATYADKPFGKLRVGIVGLGRGEAGAAALNEIPGCEITAICDLNAVRIQRILESTQKAGRPAPKVYTGGAEEWKRLCDDANVDLVYGRRMLGTCRDLRAAPPPLHAA
jgi:hypothetical protein